MREKLVYGLARLVLKAFFRRIEIEGLERVRSQGPVLLVANHVNSLIDAVLMAGTLGRLPRFLAKSTLWQMVGLRPFLALAKVIPVYRRQDKGVDTSKNMETFARCHEVLEQGGAIALFPEGISHNKPNLQPLKTGAARIALEAEERFGPLGIEIVPVGLIFGAKGMFRSRALIQVGEPLEVRLEENEDRYQTARKLTAKIEEGLRQQTLNFESWEEARLVNRAADLYARPQPELPAKPDLADRSRHRQAFAKTYRSVREAHPREVENVARAVAHYDRLLSTAGMRDDQVGAAYPMSKILRYLARTTLNLLLYLPVAVAGTILNWLPYRIPGWIAQRFATSPDVASTYKLFPAFVLFPLFWIGEAALGTWLGGWRFGLTLLVFAPLSGWLALRFHERRNTFLQEAGAYLKLRTRKGMSSELKRRRETVLREVERLMDLHKDTLETGSPS
ncbi:MAG: lysophospholipid acyltransferase family protein [Deltaproteobacteria bacterium]|nr:lysophospholipid acyltransferase family protein [Deltaproteobacteria bacterium]